MMWLTCFIHIRRMFQFPSVNQISDLKRSRLERNFQDRISSFCLGSWLPLLKSWKISRFSLKFKTNLLFDEGVRLFTKASNLS